MKLTKKKKLEIYLSEIIALNTDRDAAPYEFLKAAEEIVGFLDRGGFLVLDLGEEEA